MNLDDFKTIRKLHEMMLNGIITEQDFNMKKTEFLKISNGYSTKEDIFIALKELHQLHSDSIIDINDFNTIKQRLLFEERNNFKSDQNFTTIESTSDSNGSESKIFNVPELEKTKHMLKIDGLSMKLSNDKLYVDSPTSSETFALRSVTGIGVVDQVRKYNEELTEFNRKNATPVVAIGFWLIFGFLFLIIAIGTRDTMFTVLGTVSLGIGIFLFMQKKNPNPPRLKSAVTIMLTGNVRHFEFDKKSEESNEVAKFIALVEDTLTAYHKN